MPTTSVRLHQTCRPVDQCMYVCVEKCPLTMRHMAEAAGAAAELWRDVRPEAEAKRAKHGCVRAQADPVRIGGVVLVSPANNAQHMCSSWNAVTTSRRA